jgi:hypothetical protein
MLETSEIFCQRSVYLVFDNIFETKIPMEMIGVCSIHDHHDWIWRMLANAQPVALGLTASSPNLRGNVTEFKHQADRSEDDCAADIR